ncbi:MAG: MFS transporter [Burkholderiales bacterium]|nr:MFS transporter [Burkholderiales bacterium]MDE1926238.1 MFS transporter [Burkholderiales bacterium]MDE2161459.1 MFS transporter [Burkholderiales bacterium]MDE2503922.1 MFS transporter [Burkholderiales bacterium]
MPCIRSTSSRARLRATPTASACATCSEGLHVESSPAAPALPALTQRQVVAAIAFSGIGWAFDLFDLFILLYVAPILAKVFFPSGQQMLSIAGVYAAFTATLVMRPLGGYLFGRYADRHGRRRAMVVAATGVGISTALMGTLPTVAMIGVAATLLFLALRLIQGVFMGGMVASTHTLGTESIAPRWRGLASGIISGGGSGVGKLFASLVFLLVSAIFRGPAFAVWGWRVMFFTGLISSFLGLFVFSRLHESPLWEALQKGAKEAKGGRGAAPAPATEAPRLGHYLSIIFLCILLTTAGGGLSYLTSGYLPTFMKLVDHVAPTDLGVILSIAAIAVIASSVLAGYLTDRIGRRPAMALYGLVSLVAIPWLYHGLSMTGDLRLIGLYAVLLSGVGTFCYAPLLIVLNERFPTALRSSGTAVSWNIGFALGGSMPVVVSLFARLSADLSLALMCATGLLAAIYLAGVYFVPAHRNLMA